MSLRMIIVGDANDQGGQVVCGSPYHHIAGRAIARVGDLVFCPGHYPDGKSHGMNKIVEGHPTCRVDGIPVAVDGCRTECGCHLIGSGPSTVD